MFWEEISFRAMLSVSLLVPFSALGCGASSAGNHSISTKSIQAKAAIQLVQGRTVGTPYFPDGDTVDGGHGRAVDSIPSESDYAENYHIHSHLTFIVNGKQIAIPKAIGILPPLTEDNLFVHTGKSLYWLHTHDATGIIHIESPVKKTFTLKNFFDIWGQPLNTGNVAGFHGSLHVFINGVAYSGSLSTIELKPFEQITIEVGSPIIPAPSYTFPEDL